MRITFVLPQANLSGGIRVPTIFAQGLIQRGHKVQVVSVPVRRPTFFQSVMSLVRGHGWPIIPESEGSYLDGTNVPHKVLNVWRPISDRDVPDADVVIGTWWETLEWVAAMSPRKGVKVNFVQGYDAVFYEDRPELLNRVLDTWRLPAHKIFISRWLMDVAREKYGETAASHVPNSVDAKQFWAEPRGKQEIPTVGVLYSTPKCKGLDVALRAFSIASSRLPGIRLIAFGREKPDEHFLLPDGADFTMRPKQDEIRNIYAACDVWLCGSRCEGFGLSVIESMACRCPVVSTKVGGPLDLIQEGVNGHLVDIEDAEALADRLVRVLTLPEQQWQAMSEAAYATARRYTWDDATDLFENALHIAIERTKTGTTIHAPASISRATA